MYWRRSAGVRTILAWPPELPAAMSADRPQRHEQRDGYGIDELPRDHGSVGLGRVHGSGHDHDCAAVEASAVIDPDNDPRALVPLENVPWRETRLVSQNSRSPLG